MRSHPTFLYVGDTTFLEFVVPGNPDLSQATAEFYCWSVSSAAWMGPITPTKLTAVGSVEVPVADVVALGVGSYADLRLVVTIGAETRTYPVDVNGNATFTVKGAAA